MIDIFMESLLGALVRFGTIVTIEPGVGAVAFCGVVILTIFAAEAFDPRLMWDSAAQHPAFVAEVGLEKWRLIREWASKTSLFDILADGRPQQKYCDRQASSK